MSPYTFLLGCIGTRLAFAYVASMYPIQLPYFASLFSLDFFYIFFTGSRPIGIETGGKPIWWNSLRPLHGLMYGLYALAAFNHYSKAWIIIVADAAVGLAAWLKHHYL